MICHFVCCMYIDICITMFFVFVCYVVIVCWFLVQNCLVIIFEKCVNILYITLNRSFICVEKLYCVLPFKLYVKNMFIIVVVITLLLLFDKSLYSLFDIWLKVKSKKNHWQKMSVVLLLVFIQIMASIHVVTRTIENRSLFYVFFIKFLDIIKQINNKGDRYPYD